MKTLVISDLHIGSKGCQTKAILSLLDNEDFDRYILVGDIIDGWLFKKYKKFTYEHTKVIRRLLKLSKNKEIIWIAGNHDEFLRKYIGMEIGNIKIVDEWIENGVWFCHGDRYDGVVKLRWLGILGSIGYDLAIVIDRLVKKNRL
jgi:UDP-2,3-diacylglucosamine pyrophosphatase LpxH